MIAGAGGEAAPIMPRRGEHLSADAVEARPGGVRSAERAPQLSGKKAPATTPWSMLIFLVCFHSAVRHDPEGQPEGFGESDPDLRRHHDGRAGHLGGGSVAATAHGLRRVSLGGHGEVRREA